MTTPTEAATAAWYAVKNDTRSPSPTADPTPYIAAIVRAILAAKDAEIASEYERGFAAGAAHGRNDYIRDAANADDEARLDWLEANELALVSERENHGEEGYMIWWRVVRVKAITGESVSGHPLGSPREAIDAALGAGVEGGR